MAILLFFAVCFLAYSNGANDNFKGVASLFGSKTTRYRTAITWATATTFAGSMAAIVLAETLLKRFSGKGLVPDTLVGSPAFLLAVAVGASITVILATLTGFPISTTHSILGGLVGSGWMAVGAQVKLAVLGRTFFLPLLLSPLLAVGLGASVYVVFRWLRLQLGIHKEWWLPTGTGLSTARQVVPIPQPSSVFAMQAIPLEGFAIPSEGFAIAEPIKRLSPELAYATGTPTAALSAAHSTSSSAAPSPYLQRYTGGIGAIRWQQIMDAAHFLSAGVVGFARGLNDTPKMVALLLVLPAIGARWGLLTVAVAIALGGWLSAKRVAETMSNKITGMNAGQGFSANLVTGWLVIAASLFGLPVSTTHVSVGSLVGIGLVNRQADFTVVRNILLSWVVTLPCAATIGAITYWLTQTLA
jgi:inorganic phosphate transporter, PiT family